MPDSWSYVSCMVGIFLVSSSFCCLTGIFVFVIPFSWFLLLLFPLKMFFYFFSTLVFTVCFDPLNSSFEMFISSSSSLVFLIHPVFFFLLMTCCIHSLSFVVILLCMLILFPWIIVVGIIRPVSIYRASVGVAMGTLSILFMTFSSSLLIAASSFLFLIINISPAYVMIGIYRFLQMSISIQFLSISVLGLMLVPDYFGMHLPLFPFRLLGKCCIVLVLF